MTWLLMALLSACIPGTQREDGCVDDLVLKSNEKTTDDYGLPKSHVRIEPNYDTAERNRINADKAHRYYKASLVDCYDGDTCTFDVTLPSIGMYKNDDAEWDYGFNFIVQHPGHTGFAYVAPLAKRVNQHVRLCDINAPELHPGNPPAAVKARDDLTKWIRDAKHVVLKVPQNAHGDMYEKYGRLLVYIEADGVNLNEKQLKHGNAQREAVHGVQMRELPPARVVENPDKTNMSLFVFVLIMAGLAFSVTQLLLT